MFLRHLYKNLRHPQTLGEADTIVRIELSFRDGRYFTKLINGIDPKYDLEILSIVNGASQFLISPISNIRCIIRVFFDFVSDDNHLDHVIDRSSYDLQLTKFKRKSCGLDKG